MLRSTPNLHRWYHVRRGMLTLLAVIPIAFAMHACDANQYVGAGEIVDSSSAPQLRIEPELTIGEGRGDDRNYQFSSILSLVAMENGDIWVLDGDASLGPTSTPNIRIFDARGNFLRDVGRRGSGPGEYEQPHTLAKLADGRVVLRDFRRHGRLSIFTPAGELDTIWDLGNTRVWPFGGRDAIRVDEQGTIWLPFSQQSRGRADRKSYYLRVASNGLILDSIPFPQWPAIEVQRLLIERILPGGGTSTREVTVPYQPTRIWSWGPRGFYATARTDQYGIDFVPIDSGRSALGNVPAIKRAIEPIVIPTEERTAALERIREELAAEDPSGKLAPPPLAMHKPPLTALTFTQDGRLAVYIATPSERRDSMWIQRTAIELFDRKNRLIGKMQLPESFSMRSIVGDLLIGTARDSNDVETVRVYRMIR